MTKEQLAEKLNYREYDNELPDYLDKTAKEAGLIVVFGASDDLCYTGGVSNDEISCYGGARVIVCKDGDCQNENYIQDWDDDEEEYADKKIKFMKNKKAKNYFDAIWCPKDSDASWAYQTHIPHSTFDIMKDGGLYCKGIIFSITDLK